MKTSPWATPLVSENFGPCFAAWDADTKILFLRQRLLQLQRQSTRQECLADTQRSMYKAMHKDHEHAMGQLKEKNDALERLSEELLQVKADLEKEVRKRTRALEKKNTSLEEYLHKLEQTNIALDVLLGRHERDRKNVLKEVTTMRNLVLADLEELRRHSPSPEHQAMIDRTISNLEFVRAEQLHGAAQLQVHLSDRESTVARLIAQGHTAGTVAGILHISLRCVHSHCYSIRKKLGLSRKTRLKDYLRQMEMHPQGDKQNTK